eukprot:CAMPEP_0194029740 /NCGR_PEP_ID=MMETSP0009_2-20130614/3404_1 /TAXON_ID=210454 /ORGANISM="Grammatophora oceanica, Strain CCMP 410" /LENGTH=202 /DNA_ID=CAMNT_0038669507 /DNA_START=41 /DNA_END=649 /DNA_ORIENTATION=-
MMLVRLGSSLMGSKTPARASIKSRQFVSSSNADEDVVRHDDTSNTTVSKMVHQVTWRAADGDVSFPVHDGELLRTATLRRGLVSPHNGNARLINCRGLGTCGTCAVEVASSSAEGAVEPKERTKVESLRLSLPPHGGPSQSPHLRLACQIQVKGDLIVTKRTGFWGQYEQQAERSPMKTYFGELEFVMDRKSPTDTIEDENL